MLDHTALLAAILAFPEEDTPRLAYADWLQEHGDAADRDRAEFIRLQMIAPGRAHNGTREYALLERHWHLWLGRPDYVKSKKARPWLSDYFEPAVNFRPSRGRGRGRGVMVQVLFRRGFAEEVRCEESWWDAHSAVLLALHPIDEVHLVKTPPAAARRYR